jgi:phytoene synthase
LFLPKPRRAAITAFYAFCREVDDVVDEVEDPGVARTKLAWWQAEVAKPTRASPRTR